jgi:hypothetical protein
VRRLLWKNRSMSICVQGAAYPGVWTVKSSKLRLYRRLRQESAQSDGGRSQEQGAGERDSAP